MLCVETNVNREGRRQKYYFQLIMVVFRKCPTWPVFFFLAEFWMWCYSLRGSLVSDEELAAKH